MHAWPLGELGYRTGAGMHNAGGAFSNQRAGPRLKIGECDQMPVKLPPGSTAAACEPHSAVKIGGQLSGLWFANEALRAS